MSFGKENRRGGFSLIELVIVVVIIGIIGAIAIPRMSRGAAGASDNALRANLAILRNALDLYAAEHNGVFPTPDNINAAAKMVSTTNPGNALIDYTNVTGTAFAASKDAANGIVYGPYLRAIPPLPVGENAGKTKFGPLGDSTAGWIYEEGTGKVIANSTDTDDNNKVYNTY